MTKIAVAMLHGMGKQEKNMPGDNMPIMERALIARFDEILRSNGHDPAGQLAVERVYWGEVIQDGEDALWSALKKANRLGHWGSLISRRFMVDSLADAVAYQRNDPPEADPDSTEEDDAAEPTLPNYYEQTHEKVAESLKALAASADENSPLCIIAHSLGAIIASNYLYDLQTFIDKPKEPGTNKYIPTAVQDIMGENPLERGETLTYLYTMGNPLALWSLRYYPYFTSPITVPAPELPNYHPNLGGGWVNFYAPNDIGGYPLRVLNDAYEKAVKKDIVVNHWNPFIRWTVAAHQMYWTHKAVIERIADSLADTWIAVNGSTQLE